ncbi:MAG: dihydropteroate synthase, partial [Spirochaetes bacterium]|nr:dihydropteroate synthase [Spirochaetota bacterium]
VVEKIIQYFDIPISIDTYKSEVAEEALKTGCKIVNDISGFSFDNQMINMVKDYQPACIVMHIKGTPKNMQTNPVYEDVVKEVYQFLSNQVKLLHSQGIKEVVIDPGFGFGKSLDDNYILLKNLNRFAEIGVPILAGISRKSMIGKVVDVPPKERLAGSIILDMIAVQNGAQIIRVHDVKEHLQALKIYEKYLSL